MKTLIPNGKLIFDATDSSGLKPRIYTYFADKLHRTLMLHLKFN